MATDKLKQIGDAISNDYLGFIPTSNSTKPLILQMVYLDIA